MSNAVPPGWSIGNVRAIEIDGVQHEGDQEELDEFLKLLTDAQLERAQVVFPDGTKGMLMKLMLPVESFIS